LVVFAFGAAVLFSGNIASAQVSCTGLPAFASCTAYASGASVTYNGSKYTTVAPIPTTRDCPPNSPYNPSTDNWWTNNGTCSGGATPTSTARPTATTARATATPTTGGATATRTNTATATKAPTATATSGGSGGTCKVAWDAGTAYTAGAQVSRSTCGHNFTANYWTQGNDPCGGTAAGSCGSVPCSMPPGGTTAAYWIDNGACSGVAATPTPGGVPSATPTDGPTVNSGPGVPAHVFAPYADVMAWPTYSVSNTAATNGQKYFTLAFIISGGTGCQPYWGGALALSSNWYTGEINRLRAQGGDVIISFGGAAGTELAQACGDVASLQAAYQQVIDKYKATWIDFDVEGGAVLDAASIDRRNKALAGITVKKSYTLPVMPTGFPQEELNILSNAKSNNAGISVVNIMAMDYGGSFCGDMGQYAIQAAQAVHAQIGGNIGVTPMTGVNDVGCENFSTSNASTFISWAKANAYVTWTAFWSTNRDSNFGYTNVFKGF
jgi:hypothetical protein